MPDSAPQTSRTPGTPLSSEPRRLTEVGVAQAKMLLIQVGGRTKGVPIPEGTDLDALVVKVSSDDGALHDFVRVRPVSASTLAALQSNIDRRSETSKSNAQKARVVVEERRAEEEAVVNAFVERLSTDQRDLFQRFAKVCGFLRPEREGGGYRLTLTSWIRKVKEVCPEPSSLDWMFVRLWLASPASIANTTQFEGERQAEGKLFAIRRAVAHKKFAAAWAEQKGPLTSLPPTASRIDRGSNHPFSILREGMSALRITTKEAFFGMLAEYREAGVLTPVEYEEALREIATGKWFGLVVPFRVV